MARIGGGASKHIVFLAIVHHVEGRNRLAGA